MYAILRIDIHSYDYKLFKYLKVFALIINYINIQALIFQVNLIHVLYTILLTFPISIDRSLYIR